MLVKPTINELLNKINSRYTLVIATSRRARQLSEGSLPLTAIKADSPVTIAAQEIAEGKVTCEPAKKTN